MSQQLLSIETVLRPVISAAFKALETKTYDTSREDYMDVLMEDLFQILFPNSNNNTTVTTTTTNGAGQVIEKKKTGPKKKEKVEEKKEKHPPLPPSPVNIQKVDPTLRKKLNDAAKKYKVKYTRENDGEFLEWANRLTPEEYKELHETEKLAEQYFVTQTSTTTAPPSPPNPPQPPPVTEEEETNLKEVFGNNGESYWVDKQTGRIYEGEGEMDKETGAYPNYKPLGYVGEGSFKNIKV